MKRAILFFINLFKLKPRFGGRPEAFLAMIIEMQRLNSKVYSEKEVQQFGEVMLKVYKVDLFPYRDLADLVKNGKPDEAILKTVREEMEASQKRIELKKAIYGDGADLGEDDILKRNDKGSAFAKKLIKDMSEHVKFHEDDQKIIDDF